jgi:hypothetical protein
MTIYDELMEIINDVYPAHDEDDEWGSWEPSDATKKLSSLAYRVGQSAYQEVDNPAYDEAQCLEWKETNPGLSQSKVYWGTRDDLLTPDPG